MAQPDAGRDDFWAATATFSTIRMAALGAGAIGVPWKLCNRRDRSGHWLLGTGGLCTNMHKYLIYLSQIVYAL